MKDFGINLYSCRKFCAEEDGFLKSIRRLKEDGYTFLQVSGTSLDYEAICRAVNSADLPVRLTHVPYERLLRDTEALMREHEALGCRSIGLGMMPKESLRDEDSFRAEAERLEEIGRRLDSAGFRFFYHHHFMEFYKFGDVTILDYLLENAPHVHFTADTYWMQYGGADVCTWLRKMRGRIGCVHLKDYRIVRSESNGFGFEPAMCALGDGVMDFRRIIDLAKDCGTEYFFVEQDNTNDAPDPFGELSKSADFLKTRID